ncbi:MAG: 3'-5' exonuclease, partial [Spirochaetia bacterium]
MHDRVLKGYLVHVWVHGKQLRLAGRLENGKSFAALMARPERRRFVASPRGDSRGDLRGDWQAFDGTRLVVAGDQARDQSRDQVGRPAGDVRAATPRTPGDAEVIETGLGAAEEFLLFRGLRGPVEIHGEWTPGRRVDCVFQHPDIRAADHRGRVVWLSFDIETDRRQHVVAISLSCGTRQTVLFAGPHVDDPKVQSFPGERELLSAFAETVRAWDPDVLTGWNVADFDFQVLADRFAEQHLRFDLGRAEGEQVELHRPASGRMRVTVPGRQVVDTMRIVRGTGRSFTDLSLETVAQEVLGRGKHVSASGEEKLAELDRLRSQDPAAFCRYCLEDSRLVLDILSATGLDELTLIRAGLTGMNFELAWTSIPAFERIYGLELIRRKVLPPRSAYGGSVTGAAGGTVLEPAPGLFSHVLVFD